MVLLSTTGFALDMHVCQGNIKSIAFNTTAKSCGDMGMASENICTASEDDITYPLSTQLKKKKCCENLAVLHQVNPETSLKMELSINQTLISVPFKDLFSFEKPNNAHISAGFYSDSPPIIRTCGIFILNESFLI